MQPEQKFDPNDVTQMAISSYRDQSMPESPQLRQITIKTDPPLTSSETASHPVSVINMQKGQNVSQGPQPLNIDDEHGYATSKGHSVQQSLDNTPKVADMVPQRSINTTFDQVEGPRELSIDLQMQVPRIIPMSPITSHPSASNNN